MGHNHKKPKLTGFVGFTATPDEEKAVRLAANARCGGNKSRFMRDALASAIRQYMPPGLKN